MRIAIFETEQWEDAACRRLAHEQELVCFSEPLDSHISAPDAEVISPFVYSRLTADVLARFPRLRLVATRSSGFDHIDMDYCAAHGITVCNVPDYGDSTVAEHVFTLLLGLARHLVEAAERTRHGLFNQTGLRGFELHDRVLGVVGTGRIGRRVIQIAHGFGMAVIATDPHPDHAAARAMGFRYASLDETLAAADVLTLHTPAAPDTVHLISDRELALMKPDAVLINTARGHIVDVAALVRTLAVGRLRAVGLDVLPEEPAIREEAAIFRDPAPKYDMATLVADHALLAFPNVLVTPHNAYNTDEALHRLIDATIDNIDAFTRGEPRNVVSAEVSIPSPGPQPFSAK
ncbi:hydroxyacid dehydrogenase [Nocardia aurantiaca]|uniref:Hydroxyacid dehydrogenase n=1 Tax=Nocardia aurantiaca TaxID=2675850 RepID=A0A6I3L5E2_9NOCA|nr:hydroxyacid dehydrogenase [Nocardia aurantiaca]